MTPIYLAYAGVLELVYITVLEAVAARIKGSTPFACTNGDVLHLKTYYFLNECGPHTRTLYGPIAPTGRALALQARGCRFKSGWVHHKASSIMVSAA